MSQNTIQTKIEQIRNETQQYGNTRGRVADLLTMLNTEKLDRDGVLEVVEEITNIAPEFLEYVKTGNFVIDADAGFGGDLVVADDPAPTPTKPTWYFAKESGTYPNAGGLVVDLNNKLVILNYDGTTWSKVEIALPMNNAKIVTWTATAFTSGSQVIYEGNIYQASSATVAADVPGVSEKWQILGTDIKKKTIVKSYISIPTSGMVVGCLRNDNTVDASLSQYRSIVDVPVAGNKLLLYLAKRVRDNTPGTVYCNVLGIKAGVKTVLLPVALTDEQTKSFYINVEGYDAVSFAFKWDEYIPVLEFQEIESVPDVVKITERKSVVPIPKKAAVSFIDDDIYSWALAEYLPFMRRKKVVPGMAVISNQLSNAQISATLIEMNKIGIYEPMNHTVSHRSDGNTMTYAQQLAEIKGCKDAMDNKGLYHTAFVSPWGRFNQATLDVVAELGYKTHYRFDYDEGRNRDNFYNYGIRRMTFGSNFDSVGYSKTLAEAKAIIDEADLNKEWVVITTHYRKNSSNISTFFADLENLIDYIRSKNIEILKPADAFERFKNEIEYDNGFRITRSGQLKTDPQIVPVVPG